MLKELIDIIADTSNNEQEQSIIMAAGSKIPLVGGAR
jgi:hypothetical protein